MIQPELMQKYPKLVTFGTYTQKAVPDQYGELQLVLNWYMFPKQYYKLARLLVILFLRK